MFLAKELDKPAYHQEVRLRGYSCSVTAVTALTTSDRAKVLKRVMPGLTRQDYLALAEKHAAEAVKQEADWGRLADEAAMETFGRPWEITDYKVSGVGRDEFSEEKKIALRFAAQAESNHKDLSRAHAWAARYHRSGQDRRAA